MCRTLTYTLPRIIDADSDKVERPAILLGLAGLFTTLNNNMFTFSPSRREDLGNHTIEIVLRDLSKYSL